MTLSGNFNTRELRLIAKKNENFQIDHKLKVKAASIYNCLLTF